MLRVRTYEFVLLLRHVLRTNLDLFLRPPLWFADEFGHRIGFVVGELVLGFFQSRPPSGGSKTSTGSIDCDLGPLRELLGALLIASWCLRELQSFKVTPTEPQHLIRRAFSMQF